MLPLRTKLRVLSFWLSSKHALLTSIPALYTARAVAPNETFNDVCIRLAKLARLSAAALPLSTTSLLDCEKLPSFELGEAI